jgi:hypothetical protein
MTTCVADLGKREGRRPPPHGDDETRHGEPTTRTPHGNGQLSSASAGQRNIAP